VILYTSLPCSFLFFLSSGDVFFFSQGFSKGDYSVLHIMTGRVLCLCSFFLFLSLFCFFGDEGFLGGSLEMEGWMVSPDYIDYCRGEGIVIDGA